jgi:hypothetical protein
MTQSMPHDLPLTPQQVDDFFRCGYLVIPTPQISLSEVEWCRKILMKLIDRRTGLDHGRYFDLAARPEGNDGPSPQILSPSLYATELRKLSYRKTALATAKQLLGAQASFSGDQAIFKPSGNGAATPWHQDEAFRDPAFEYNELSIWIALTDGTSEAAAMRYIPGSHLIGVRTHQLRDGASDADTIECCDGFDPQTAVSHPIPAGAMIIHHGRTIHGAAGNRSEVPRLAYVVSYLTPPKKRLVPLEFPWLEELRRSTRKHRNITLLRGGVFLELVRILRSDRYADRHFLSGFVRRRIKQLQGLWRRF